MADIEEHHGTLAGEPVFWLQAGDDEVPVLYVHGVPTNAHEWTDFLTRTGGIAPDLPGFGRSGKRADGDYTMDRYGPWLDRFLADRGIDRFRLVVHDWGGVALRLAMAQPERVEKVVILNAVPFLPGYRWHRLARLWRTKWAGELSMGALGPFTIRQLTRESNVTKGKMPKAWLDAMTPHVDLGTQRAILRLYRSADPERLAEIGHDLGRITCPSLVVWADQDPYLPAHFGDDYARALPDAELVHLPDAGHWSWLDRPDVLDTVADFLAG